MAAKEAFQENSVGPVFKITCKVGTAILDISTVTIKKILFLPKGAKTTIIKDAEFDTDGTNGILKYKFLKDDLVGDGTWKAQAFVYFSEDDYYYSSSVEFDVEKNLGEVALIP